MKNKNLLAKISLISFIVIELILTIVIFVLDKYYVMNTTMIKYSSIVLCFIVACFGFNSKRGYFLIAGLAGTLVADYFLLVKLDNFLIGISSFIIVQSMYFLYIKPRYWKISLIIRFLLFIVVSLVIGLGLKVKDTSVFFAAFYFVNLLMNAIDAFMTKDIKFILFGIGLILFIGCDLSVAFYNLTNYVSYSSDFIEKIVDFSEFGMWLFYIPSQTLLAITPFIRKKYE